MCTRGSTQLMPTVPVCHGDVVTQSESGLGQGDPDQVVLRGGKVHDPQGFGRGETSSVVGSCLEGIR